ncbi:glycosyl transferase family 2 [Candidatus Aerophobetes bacterium]|uniref:Glycosyl transferase family 2 n=1 Tax=Aerophobetes bacterium TaxID=2030807 RepID=A0A2A4X2J1_UNCAE|nr:MAG: glycosyl transferase family 2 [Candidatus Aerophobetes bacterium]
MISVTILTKNSSATLLPVLQSTASFNEVVLIDTGSTDDTLDIAKVFCNVKIYKRPFKAFGALRIEAAQLASHDWVLALDSDEVLTPELAREILELNLDPSTIYGFSFHNFFKNKRIRHCGWSPDKHLRLYNKLSTNFSNANVHECIEKKNLKVKFLKFNVNHYSYQNMGDFLRKMQLYSDLFAQQHKSEKHSSFFKAWVHSFFAFFKTYILKLGFLDGKEGYIIAKYNSHVAWYKYLKLEEEGSS